MEALMAAVAETRIRRRERLRAFLEKLSKKSNGILKMS
jgi:hypothetical protein